MSTAKPVPTQPKIASWVTSNVGVSKWGRNPCVLFETSDRGKVDQTGYRGLPGGTREEGNQNADAPGLFNADCVEPNTPSILWIAVVVAAPLGLMAPNRLRDQLDGWR